MTNFLNNGAVLPHGLLGNTSASSMAGFNKTYRNTSIRMGIIVESYPKSHDNNHSKLTTEYDVLVFEQNEDKGSSVMTYKNCLSSEGLGSIADFFEKTLRVKESKSSQSNDLNTSGQNGAVVLIQCIDGMTEKAIIVSGLTHPDRSTTLSNSLHLEGEYNGVNIKVNNDGSTSLVFKGATDNNGKITDPSQGPTTVKIETDGSYQVDHKTIKFRMDKNGVTTLHAKSDIIATSDEGDIKATATTGNILAHCKQNIEATSDSGDIKVTATAGKVQVICEDDVEVTTQEGDVTVTAEQGDIEVNAQAGNATVTCMGIATVEGAQVKLGEMAFESVIKGTTFAQIYNNHTHLGNLGVLTEPPLIKMDAALSLKVKTE